MALRETRKLHRRRGGGGPAVAFLALLIGLQLATDRRRCQPSA